MAQSEAVEVAIVKIKGPQTLVEVIVEALEEEFTAIRTSSFKPNDPDPGVHIYVAVTGRY